MILELHEGERRAALVLEVDEDNLAVLVEEVLDVLIPDVRRQVADVDPGLTPSRHDDSGHNSQTLGEALGLDDGLEVVSIKR